METQADQLARAKVIMEKEKVQWPVRKLDLSELVPLSLFFKGFFRGQAAYGDMDTFHWKVWRNPYLQGFVSAILVDKKIASTTSIVPKKLWYLMSPLVVAEIGDSYTSPEHHRKGMFAAVGKQARAEAEKVGIGYVYGLPNDQALPGWEKHTGFKRSSTAKVHLLHAPLRLRKILRKKLRFQFLSDLFLAFWSPLASLFWKTRSSSTYEVSKYEGVVPEMADIFENAKSKFAFIFDRSLKSLRWRFEDSPSNYHFYVARKGEKAAGYIVGRFLVDEVNSKAVIADFLTIEGEEKALSALVGTFVRDAMNADCEKIEVWCSMTSPYFKPFRSLGLKPHSREVPIIAFNNQAGQEINNHSGAWHFTISDSDNI